MGAASSSELQVAKTAVRKLTEELRKSQQLAAVHEQALQAAQSKAVVDAATASAAAAEAAAARKNVAEKKDLEAKLRQTREEADAQRAQVRAVRAELESVRDELRSAAGDAKIADLRETPRGARGDEAKAAAALVRDASAALLDGDAAEKETHAVFGELLASFGGKRLYRADPRTLWTGTRLWEKQRAFREDRAAEIAKAKSSSPAGWPGAISVVETEGDDVAAVVDGQHRLGAAWLLAASDAGLPPRLAEIVVEVYGPLADGDVHALFAEINKAEPVALVDLEAGGASDDVRAALDSAAAALAAEYPDMFKPSKNCRAPHVNVDSLRDELFQAGVLDVVPHGDLLPWLRERNAALAAYGDDQWLDPAFRCRASAPAARRKALDKARAHGLFLGMTWDWLYASKP